MLGSAALVAFVGATDPGRARAFYGGVLGVELVEETEFACVFRTPGAELRVALVGAVEAAPYTVLGWRVDDVRAVVRRLAAAGVETVRYPDLAQDALGVWTSPAGARVAWFRDPDGNLLSVTEA